MEKGRTDISRTTSWKSSVGGSGREDKKNNKGDGGSSCRLPVTSVYKGPGKERIN